MNELISKLGIARIEDLPYISSPPIQFVYEESRSLLAGQYSYPGTPSPLTPVRPIQENTLYFFRSIFLSADVSEDDYLSGISTLSVDFTPKFKMYVQSGNDVQLFREPIVMNRFYDDFTFRFAWITQNYNDQLLASFDGFILQSPSLIGKTSITLKAVISAQEIVSDTFIKAFKKQYPDLTRE
jgi:hypothetical protein